VSRDTLHERWLRNTFHDVLRAGMDTTILGRYLDDITDREADRPQVDFLFQHSWDATTVYDAYAFGLIQSWYSTGILAFVSVEVGAGPESDQSVELNNQILRGVPAGFSAEFEPGRGTGTLDDGRFSWRLPIRAETYVDGRRVALAQPAGGCPLEVGYTRASRTLRHLIEHGALARWPYDREKILLGILTPRGREMFRCLGVVSDRAASIQEYDGIDRLVLVSDGGFS
jgi:hypothetical protein